MPAFHFAPLIAPVISQPRCPQCGEPMLLTVVEPSIPDHDLRTFECGVCGQRTSVMVKYR